MKTTVISVLGTQKDAHGGAGKARWDTWRPSIGLVQQEELPIDELHLIFNKEYQQLAERVKADIKSVSPETKVIFDIIQLKDPWDFEEVYGKFYEAHLAFMRLQEHQAPQVAVQEQVRHVDAKIQEEQWRRDGVPRTATSGRGHHGGRGRACRGQFGA